MHLVPRSLLLVAVLSPVLLRIGAAQEVAPPSPAAQAGPAPAVPAIVPSYADDPKFQKAVSTAKDNHQPQDERLAQWKKANKIAKGKCVDCLHHILNIQMKMQAWKDAIGTSHLLEGIGTEPKEKFFALSRRGEALMHSNYDSPKPEQLQEADVSFTAALAIVPNSVYALYSEGRVLAMLGREAEEKAIFQRYLDGAKESDHYRTRVEHFLENPHLAAMPMAPPFTVVTSEGEQLTLDDMGGKVVLLDFWATWCGPCNATLPDIKKLAKDFANDPFVVISVSSDRDEGIWKTFIAKNEMTWPQVRDANGDLNRAYSVGSIPHYFTIDTDGVLTTEMVGSNADVRGKLKKMIAKARKARENMPVTPAKIPADGN